MVTGSPGFFGNGSFFRVSVLYTCNGMASSNDGHKKHEETQKMKIDDSRSRGAASPIHSLFLSFCASLWLLLLLDQRHRVAPDGLAAADVADVLARLRLHVDGVQRQFDELCDVLPDAGLPVAQFRLLGEDCDVQIDRFPPRLVHPAHGLSHKPGGVRILV